MIPLEALAGHSRDSDRRAGAHRSTKREPKGGTAAKKGKPRQSNRRAKVDRAPDPDSPFAKLAALKDSLTKSDG